MRLVVVRRAVTSNSVKFLENYPTTEKLDNASTVLLYVSYQLYKTLFIIFQVKVIYKLNVLNVND